MLVQVSTNYACAGIEISKQGIVVKTAPIFSWMKGKSIYEIKKWKQIKKFEVVTQ